MKRIAGFIVALCLCLSTNTFAAADGWASMNGGTTGGEGGIIVTVDNFTDLEYYAELGTAPYVIQISGTIDIDSDGFDIHANKTLIGLGSNATLVGNVGFNNREGNIIIENLNITNPHSGSPYDGLSVKQDIYNVLVTKCTIYDCGDGGFDITNRSDFVTVSWCKFYFNNPAPDEGHRFMCLVGASDKQTDDIGKLNVTYHHNWWANRVKERMPRVRYGQVHVYNNYYSNLEPGGYCVGVGCGSHLRVENNYFNAVPNPWKDYYTSTSYDVGHIGWNTGNVFYNCTQPTWATNEYATMFTPPYDYTLDTAAEVQTIVQAYAGAGTPYSPHWLSGAYGDFDTDGDVDTDDLETYFGYWLDTDDIVDADYDENGRVDIVEFVLFAGNWLSGL